MADDVGKSKWLKQRLEEIAETVVFFEPSDEEASEDLKQKIEQVGRLVEGENAEAFSQITAALIRLIDSLEGEGDTEATVDILNRTVGALQEVVRDDRPIHETVFPEELGVKLLTSDDNEGAETPGGDLAEVGQQSSEETDSAAAPARSRYVLPANVDEAIVADFLSRQPSVLEEMEEYVLQFEVDGDSEALAALRRIFHTSKGETALLGMRDVGLLCHVIEDALDGDFCGDIADALFKAKDWLSRAYASYSGDGPEPEPVSVIIDEVKAAVESCKIPNASEPGEQASGKTEIQKETAAETVPGVPVSMEGYESIDVDEEVTRDFLAIGDDLLEIVECQLAIAGTDALEGEPLNAALMALRAFGGLNRLFGYTTAGAAAQEVQGLLDRLYEGNLEYEVIAGIVGRSVEMFREHLNQVDQMAEGESPTEALDYTGLLDEVHALGGGDVVGLAEKSSADSETDSRSPAEAVTAASGVSSREASEEAERPLKGANVVDGPQPERVTTAQRVFTAEELAAVDASLPGMGNSAKAGAARPEKGSSGSGAGEPDNSAPTQNKPSAPAAPAKASAAPASSGDRSNAKSSVRVKETIKVDAERLDQLVDTIGELVIAESMVSQISSGIKDESGVQLSRIMGQLDKITRELQEMGLGLRMVPVRSTFQKMARLARDVGKKTGKRINFVMSGEETDLDKTVVDNISDPLVHMVRNAVDHGIEASTEERVKAGKPPVGRIELRAFHQGGNIVVEIEDDGRGIDPDVIFAKGVERGLVEPDDQLTEREILNLLFEPGFTTADSLTDVSGRGVGMDVVKKGIEALRGKVEIRSEKGKGSVFSIRLPLTLAIIDGMVVTVGRERYIIPTLSTTRLIRPQEEDLSTVLGRGETMMLGGDLLPIFRLNDLFGIPDAQTDLTKALMVVVEHEGRRACLVTDETLGQQQIVIKSLGEMFRGVKGISGGAIMPDGRVGLILDVGGIVNLAHSGKTSRRAEAEPTKV